MSANYGRTMFSSQTSFELIQEHFSVYSITLYIVNVGESQIMQSLKVRDLGVTFDQFRNFDDHNYYCYM